MKTITKGWLLAFVLTLCSVLAASVQASHGRFGHFTWEPRSDIGPTTVDFRLVVAFRRSYFGSLQLGQSFRPGSFSFGDGRSASYNFEVIALNVQEDWVIGRAYEPGGDPGVVRHTYSTPTKTNGEPWLATMSVCCRISSLRNSADSDFIVRTRIDLSKDNSSPVSSLPPIVTCPRGNCRFSIPVVDKNRDPIRWSLTPQADSGIRANPPGLAVDPATGFVDWSQGSTSAALGLYAVAVTIEDLDADGNPKSSVVTDFIINLQEFVDNQPPAFDRPPSPEANAAITAVVGQELVVEVQATDSDLNDEVFLNNLGLPPGAQFETLTQGNPTVARLLWTPELKHVGDHLVTFSATDQKAASALPLPVVLKVTQPAIRDVQVIDRVSALDIDVEHSSFSVPPAEVRLEGGQSVIEWRYPTFDVGQIENLNFDLRLKHLLPGETRLVIHDLELRYKDVNGNEVVEQLGSRTITVSETVLALTTATDKIQYKADETVVITSNLVNLDDIAAAGTVSLSVVDAAGNPVRDLGSFNESLQANEARTLSGKNFVVGNTLAGNYRVIAELTNEAGKVVATVQAPFAVVTDNGTEMNLASAVYPDKTVYGGWDNVAISARLQNAAGNALLGETRNKITVTAPDGSVLLQETRVLSSLSANAVRDFNFYLQLSDAPAGSYQVRWVTHDGNDQTLLAQSQASFAVERAMAQSVVGHVAVDQSRVFHTASNSCRYQVENRSRTPAGAIELAYSLIHLESEQVVARQSLTTDLAANAGHEWQQPVGATGLTYGGYGCILEANLDGRWQVIASAGFEVLPPKISSSLSLGDRGRLLVLADAPRQCSALEDIRFAMDFGADLGTASKVEVKLYDQNRVLLDTQVVTQFGLELNSSVASGADLAVKASAGGEIEALVKAGAQAHLGSRYIVVVNVQQNIFVKTRKEWSIDTTCDRPFTLDELYEDVRLLAYRPWQGEDDVRSADPFGPLDGPTVEEQEAVLESLLETSGWEYTLVHSAEAFTEAHRSGGYTVYALLAERPMLPVLVQKEIREAVFNGAGLVVAGAFDKRNLFLEHALGVTVVGRHPWARDLTVTDSELTTAWSMPLPVSDWVQGVYRQGAEQIGEYELVGDSLLSQWFWLDQGGFSLNDLFGFKRRALTRYDYGKGKAVFASFDLLLQSTAAGPDSVFGELLSNALAHVHPSVLSRSQTAVVPLHISLSNERGATSGRATLELPPGAEMTVPNNFRLENGHWIWNFAAPEQGSLENRVYVRLPAQDNQATFDLKVASDIENQYLEHPGQTLTLSVVPQPTLETTLATLDELAWRYWYRLQYRDAHVKFKLAKEAIANGHWLTAQTLLITVTNLLLPNDEEAVRQARWQVDAHIRAVSRKLGD